MTREEFIATHTIPTGMDVFFCTKLCNIVNCEGWHISPRIPTPQEIADKEAAEAKEKQDKEDLAIAELYKAGHESCPTCFQKLPKLKEN